MKVCPETGQARKVAELLLPVLYTQKAALGRATAAMAMIASKSKDDVLRRQAMAVLSREDGSR